MRALEPEELPVIEHLLAKAGLHHDLHALRVRAIDDGGMGSLRFVSPTDEPRFGASPAECWFADADGVPVSVQLNLDQAGELFELDVWRVDFLPVQRWPTADGICSRPPTADGGPRP